MALASGTKLGPHEILSLIGAGGMGEVYKARDTRLDRIVAIKVLPAHLADNPDLRERFEREAKTIAGLNHPHICTLYDVGRQDGTDFLVMEYLEGETLATRLLKGPLPLDQVLRYAIEISDALDKAHRQGVTHRDLKPGNLMLTKSGSKLLDFGLAKLKQDAAPAATPLSQLPTLSKNPTVEGTILGTLQYMAPEQVEGKTDDIDPRTDIFSFGVLLYEMATGKKAFEGKSTASLFAKILEHHPPPISSLQPMTPPALDRIVKRCLAKEPDERWQSAGDLTHELKWIAEGGSQTGMRVPVATGRKGPLSNARLAWSVAAVLLVAALAVGAVAYLRRAPEEARAVRFFVSPPNGWNLAQRTAPTSGGAPNPLAVSPDGQRVAFVAASSDGRQLLWVRSLDTLTAEPLAGTEGAARPFWSPDSRFLGFFADGKLRRIGVSGGPPIALCDAPDSRGGAWNRDGLIVFSPGAGALQKMPSAGGTPTPASVLGQGETRHSWPFFLPDSRHFLYHALQGQQSLGIYLASLDSTEQELLLDVDSGNVLYSRGHLLFLRETTLMAQPFDAQRLEPAGDAFPIAEQIQTQASPLVGVFSVSENGVLAYQTGMGAAGTQLMWFDRAGKQIDVVGEPAAYGDVELSPEGKWATVSIPDRAGGTRDIWVVDVARGLRTRFTSGAAGEQNSIWSPDGSRVVFNSSRKGPWDLYQKASDGSGAEEVLLESNFSKFPTAWSPDGRSILVPIATGPTGSDRDLFVLSLSGDRKLVPFLQTQFIETFAQFSPDGRWVAYQSNESGRYEVYVAPFPGPSGRRLVSNAGGTYARWRPDGTELFYLAADNKLMVAAVNGRGSSFEVGAVRPLFQTVASLGTRRPYDVSANGQRFLVNTLPEQTASAPITVVLNWTAAIPK